MVRVHSGRHLYKQLILNLMKKLILFLFTIAVFSSCKYVDLTPSVNFDGEYIQKEQPRQEIWITGNTIFFVDSVHSCHLISVTEVNNKKTYIVNNCPFSYGENGKDISYVSFCGITYRNKVIRKR